MQKTTIAFAQKITYIGKKIESSTSSQDKAKLIAELALLVSQDAGGITYMTNNLHEIVAAGGLVPGLAAVLSITVSQRYIKENPIPEITSDNEFNKQTYNANIPLLGISVHAPREKQAESVFSLATARAEKLG